MRRRLYYLLPNVLSARALLDELLLARIEERYLHFYAKEGVLLPDMPEVNLLQKTDLVHGLERGMLIGIISGLLAGTLFLMFPGESPGFFVGALLLSSIGGGLLGSLFSVRTATAVPNSKLSTFANEIEENKVVLIVDVPLRRVAEIERLIVNRHPDSRLAGVEKHVPILS